MMARLLYWLSSYLPCRIISDKNRPYLERYFLWQVLGWTFYLHRFVDSDPGRGLHDHPWDHAFSLILVGEYWEERRRNERWRTVRWFNSLTGDTFHRVILPDTARPCWTLFFHNGQSKAWGFMAPVMQGGIPTANESFRPHRDRVGARPGRDRWWETAPIGMFAAGRQP